MVNEVNENYSHPVFIGIVKKDLSSVTEFLMPGVEQAMELSVLLDDSFVPSYVSLGDIESGTILFRNKQLRDAEELLHNQVAEQVSKEVLG